MGFLYKLGRIRSYILIILFFVAILISAPIKRKVVSSVDAQLSVIKNSIYNATGLSVVYETMSPSILSNFVIKEIQIVDEQKYAIIEISKAKIGFNLASLFKRDMYNIVSSVTVDGIKLDVDKIIDLVNRISVSMNDSNLEFSQIQKAIPSNIKVKNLYLTYEDDTFEAAVNIKTISLNNDVKKEYMNVQSDSHASLNIIPIKKSLDCKINLNGHLNHSLEKSYANIKFNDLSDGNYFLNKLNFHVDYENHKIGVYTIQATNPIYAAFDLNVQNFDLNAQLKTEQFYPLNVINNNSKQKELKKFKNVSLDTDTILKCNLIDKNLNFVTDTSLYVPEEIFPGGFTIDFSAYGNEKECELTDFEIEGDNLSASASMSFIYKTKQLSGFAGLTNFVLNNGNSISTEVYFDPLDKGFMAFSPQLFIGQKAYTALQLSLLPQNDSYDFIFEAYDYAHSIDSEPGFIQLDGSYLTKSNYFQSNIGLNSLYFDSLAYLVAQLVKPELAHMIEKYMDKMSSFVLSGDMYASTDLKSISYNIPYVLMANTEKENQALMLALNGSNDNVQLNQLSLILGKYVLEASASVDKNPGTDDLFYNLDLNAASIPYHFSGSIMQNRITVSGDYGTDVEINFGKKNQLDGYAFLENVPVAILDKTFIFSLDSKFNYDKENGPACQINRFETEIADSTVMVSPKISLSGNMTKYGAQINSIAYTDMYSTLEGTADLMLNINEKVFDSVGIMLDLKNPISDEGISIDGSISNPEHLSLTKENILNYIYMNLQLQLNSFGLNRFVLSQNENNRITATLYTSGTMEHPYVSLNIDDSAIWITPDFLKMNGSLILEDKTLTLNDFNINFKFINVNNLTATASLEDFSLDASGNLDCQLFSKTVFAPLTLNVSNALVPEGKILPDSFMVTLATEEFSGTMIKKKFPLSFSAIYSDKVFSIYSSENCGLSGSYSTDGILDLSLDNKNFIKANLSGILNSDQMSLQLYDFVVELPQMLSYLNFDDLIIVNKGQFTADVMLTGTTIEPDFDGRGIIKNPEIKLPSITNNKLSTEKIDISILQEELTIENFILSTKDNQKLDLGLKVFLNRWSINRVEASVKTLKKDLFPVKISTPIAKINGDVSLDVDIVMEDKILDVNGKVFGENMVLSSSVGIISNFTQKNNYEASKNDLLIRTDLDILLGTHASLHFDPVLRCIFVPNTSINVKYDQTDSSVAVDGQLGIKSGDLAYLNRNFYIKTGTIKFNSDDISNPLVTINAETRERDDRGQNIKILLSVENQYLLNLEPKFTSVPAKSENEIRAILGQIVVADSENAANFLFAASDYAIQSTVVRTAENKLRDLFNFDIFSVRTNLLQNTLNRSFSRTMSEDKLTIGNLLDNSTVYIGKYLGSFLYLDAMLHVSFEDRYGNDITSAGSLIFQPEFGMEMESPFANIRVNLAPDINALLNNQFVPSTSVTLSWKFAF